MSLLLTTGPVENAAANASISTWVKVLNNNSTGEVNVEVSVFSLNGEKTQIANSSFVVGPMASEYDVFEVTDVLEYEVEVTLSNNQNVLVSIWGKDANANLVAAHRYVNNELAVIGQNAANSDPQQQSAGSKNVNKIKKTARHRSR